MVKSKRVRKAKKATCVYNGKSSVKSHHRKGSSVKGHSRKGKTVKGHSRKSSHVNQHMRRCK